MVTEEFNIAVRSIYDRSINSNMKTYSGNTKHVSIQNNKNKQRGKDRKEKKWRSAAWWRKKCSLHLSPSVYESKKSTAQQRCPCTRKFHTSVHLKVGGREQRKWDQGRSGGAACNPVRAGNPVAAGDVVHMTLASRLQWQQWWEPRRAHDWLLHLPPPWQLLAESSNTRDPRGTGEATWLLAPLPPEVEPRT